MPLTFLPLTSILFFFLLYFFDFLVVFQFTHSPCWTGTNSTSCKCSQQRHHPYANPQVFLSIFFLSSPMHDSSCFCGSCGTWLPLPHRLLHRVSAGQLALYTNVLPTSIVSFFLQRLKPIRHVHNHSPNAPEMCHCVLGWLIQPPWHTHGAHRATTCVFQDTARVCSMWGQ